MRVAVKFAYDGRRFHGYARQPGIKTVDDEMLHLLIENNLFTDVKTACVRVASRTDKGVSALGNVLAFHTDSWDNVLLLQRSQKQQDIFLYGFIQVSDDFYPRHARQRIYRYYLDDDGLDLEKLLEAAAVFTGEHDFRNFARVEPLKNPLRTIDTILVEEKPGFYVIDFYAQTFLWHQIRRVVSAMKKVAGGTLEKKTIVDALAQPEIKVDYGLAPAEPLLLKDVLYDFDFDYLPGAVRRLQQLERDVATSIH
ncbi:MAG: tRNA pseudouridine(38-40) synthase TruA [Methanobacteriota archaeon]